MVRVSLTNSVQLTLHFAMNIDDFYRANGATRLVDRVCALFGIVDQSRVKIVSVYTGSVKVTVMFSAALPPESESTTATNSSGLAEMQTLQTQIDGSISSGLLGSTLAEDGLSPLISAATTLIPMHPQDNSEGSED